MKLAFFRALSGNPATQHFFPIYAEEFHQKVQFPCNENLKIHWQFGKQLKILSRIAQHNYASLLIIALWTFSIIYIYKRPSILPNEYLFLRIMEYKLHWTESERLCLWDETRIRLLIPTTFFCFFALWLVFRQWSGYLYLWTPTS